jgi:hypothetical protein
VNGLRTTLYSFLALALSGAAAAIASSVAATAATTLQAHEIADASRAPTKAIRPAGAKPAAAIAGPTGPAGADGLAGEKTHGFKWVDATGATVGLAAPYSQAVLVTIDGQRYAVSVFRWGDFQAQQQGHWHIAQPARNEAIRFYESEDCTGLPYFEGNPELGATAPAAMDWHADGSTDIITLAPETHIIKLKCYRDGNSDIHLYPNPYWAELYVATNIHSMDLMFPPPLSFE